MTKQDLETLRDYLFRFDADDSKGLLNLLLEKPLGDKQRDKISFIKELLEREVSK